MKELAQLPTPTIATRTLSSARPAPLLPFAPLVSLMRFEVLPRSGWVAKHTRSLDWLQMLRAAPAADWDLA